jgi:hypothetical protein
VGWSSKLHRGGCGVVVADALRAGPALTDN